MRMYVYVYVYVQKHASSLNLKTHILKALLLLLWYAVFIAHTNCEIVIAVVVVVVYTDECLIISSD